MRLTSIKLAGFKSFVDPTTLPLPTNITCVVGPNGSGKSNIIDAVRWVLGENAASRLRSENITDVIFAGSTTRKPAGQASVELVFDNGEGKLGGEWANFAEISVRREVGRDAQSNYFINGTRCRRRDITDLFLGTGLGARSYAIIEQGIISDIVESQPEHLRVHLEEAAGISKYKERRKETESRIKATRENLDRVRDVRDEVDKQIGHLDRQARAAERWQALKIEQARREAELRALDYRALAAEHGVLQQRLSASETALAREQAAVTAVENRLEHARSAQGEAGTRFNAAQAETYRIGAEVARIEQQLRHGRETGERLQRERDELDAQIARAQQQAQDDAHRHEELSQAQAEQSPQIEALRAEESALAQAAQQAESDLTAWQQQWESHTRDAAAVARDAEVERNSLGHLEREGIELARRRENLQRERAGTDLAALQQALGDLDARHAEQQHQLEALNAQLETHKTALAAAQQQERDCQASLDAARKQVQGMHGRMASLEALQSAALGEDDAQLRSWLQQAGLADAARLGALLRVEAGWEQAVEAVLGAWLEGVVCTDAGARAAQLDALREADLGLLDAAAAAWVQATPSDALNDTLAARVQGPAAALALLEQVHVASDAAQAQARLAQLPPGHSVITADGLWLGAGRARVQRRRNRQAGVLARAREIETLRAEQQQAESSARAASEALQAASAQRAESERLREQAQRDLYQAHRAASDTSGQRQGLAGKLDLARSRLARVDEELGAVTTRAQAIEETVRGARGKLEGALTQMQAAETRRQTLEAQRRTLLEAREEARGNQREATARMQRLALAQESRRSTLDALQQAIARGAAQLAQLQQQATALQQQAEQARQPLAELEAERALHLQQRLLADQDLVAARAALEQADAALRTLEGERAQAEQRVQQAREQGTELRLLEQAQRLRSEQIAAAIRESGLDPDELLATLAADADIEHYRSVLADLGQKIQRLEPVNLAAIQEHAEQAQRKTYLDAQLADLTEALETLEGAIRKIDRETRQLFRDTFDKVNAGLQELFPRLFGGGTAYLELTGEDLLDAGVAIMARPPGKRVSNISQLSGGEKALIAVALVFAIFRLNPAPFCILDEVDAPLDEANVGRFTELVRELSEQVQFLYVTHNKTSMEAAHHLCGVAMREPGVSRLVQVDLDEAAKLAGAA